MNQNAPVVLVIEDHEQVASLSAYILRRAHFQPIVARDGLEGLGLAREHLPAFIVCDALLPGLSGMEILAILRSQPDTAAIPFILMSGAPAAHYGFPMPDAFLPKPFGKDALIDLVQRHIRLPSTASADPVVATVLHGACLNSPQVRHECN